jgi:predicted phage terminase large subunit-like protein
MLVKSYLILEAKVQSSSSYPIAKQIVNKLIQNDLKAFFLKCFATLNPGQVYCDNWHVDLMLEYMKAMQSKQVKRLLINIPPRSLKSFCLSVVWPAWLLAKSPEKRIIVASYSQSLSNKHSIDCRSVMLAEWYQELFPNTIVKLNQKNKFTTSKEGFRFATSVGGTLTGEGADFIIVDDPQSSLEALSPAKRERVVNWYQQTLSSRLNDKNNGCIAIVMQRLHQADLSGVLLKKKIFQHLSLPLIAVNDQEYRINNFKYLRKAGDILNPVRDSASAIELLKQELGEFAFSAQYQQNPYSLNNNIIKSSWIKRYETFLPSIQIIQSWDCAIKTAAANDYSACSTWGINEGNYYLLEMAKYKLAYPQLKQQIIIQAQKFNPYAILIEDKASGQQLIQELKGAKLSIIPIMPKYDKQTRLILNSVLFEAGRVYFPYNADWLEELETELLAFPNAVHDDQVDSITQFLSYISATNQQLEAKIYSL